VVSFIGVPGAGVTKAERYFPTVQVLDGAILKIGPPWISYM
jgi:hypothetical protein